MVGARLALKLGISQGDRSKMVSRQSRSFSEQSHLIRQSESKAISRRVPSTVTFTISQRSVASTRSFSRIPTSRLSRFCRILRNKNKRLHMCVTVQLHKCDVLLHLTAHEVLPLTCKRFLLLSVIFSPRICNTKYQLSFILLS